MNNPPASTDSDAHDHNSSHDEVAVADVEGSSQTPTSANNISNTVNAQEPPTALDSTGLSSHRAGFASPSRVNVRLLGSWAMLPEATRSADYGRVQLVMRGRGGHAYKTVTLIKSPARMRSRVADSVARGSKPWRGSPLKGDETISGSDCRVDLDAPDQQDMPRSKPIAANPLLDTLYHNIRRRCFDAHEKQKRSFEYSSVVHARSTTGE